MRFIESLFPLRKVIINFNLIKAYEAIVILRVKVKKQLDGKANKIIESCQEIISELCSLQECGDFTWRVSDWEELVGVNQNKTS